MALDGVFLHLLRNEIADKLIGCRVDKIHQPSRDELLFTFRTEDGAVRLLMSAKSDCPRVQITNAHIENPQKPPMLTMLLRKHLCGARLSDIIQDGFERILTFVFDAKNELGDPVTFCVIAEIMGRHSNIILVDQNDIIVDCVKRVDSETSSVREVLPTLKYVLPPQQKKYNILTDDAAVITDAIADADARKICDTIQGVSPIVAREIENGMTISQLKNYIFSPVPTVVFVDRPKDYTYFRPAQYGDLCDFIDFATFSDLLDYYYSEQVRIDRIRQRSNDLFRLLSTMQERAVRKSLNRQRELDECRDKDTLRIYGEIINANLHRLEKGALFYDLENFYDDMAPIRIPADPTLSPVQNAQKYYKEYRKKQIAETKLHDFIRQADGEAEYLESVIDSLSRAETDSEISAIRAELYDEGFITKSVYKSRKQKKLSPRKYRTSEGFIIYVGRNNVQNDQLTLRTAKNYDLWFHVKDYPGSHVIVPADKSRPFTDRLIRDAAMLAVVYSKASASSNVAVDYTIVKNVHKPNGAKPGMVIYNDYNTEYVTPNDAELKEVVEIE